MKLLNKVSDMVGKYFMVWILVVAAWALLYPKPFIAASKSKFLGESPITIGLILIMFIMGLTLKKDDFKVVLTRPKDIFFGCLAQFTIMPLVAFGLAVFFKLPPVLAVGLVLLGTCPGGTASNVMTYLAKGDVALSVGMTIVSTLLSPILTPVLTYFLAGAWVKIDIYSMVISIVKIVVLPILFGMLGHQLFGRTVQRVKKVLVVIPILSILFIMGLCVAPNKSALLNAGFVLVLAVCLHNWAGFALGYLVGKVCKMDTKKKRAISIEVGLQNSGLAVGLGSQFANPLTALPSIVATVVHQVSGSLLSSLFNKNSDDDDDCEDVVEEFEVDVKVLTQAQ